MTTLDSTIQLPGGAWRFCQVHWESLPDAYAYPPGEAHVYLAATDEHEHDFREYRYLSQDIERSAYPAAGLSSLVRQRGLALAMRHFVLSCILGVPADTLHFSRTGAGRPRIHLPDGSQPLHFSQSHVDKYVALVVSDASCGIDMEILRDPERYPHLRRQGFPPDWSARLMNLAGEPKEKRWLFTAYWTALESLYKKEGGPSLHRFLRERLPRGGAEKISASDREFCGFHFNVDSEHLACVTLSCMPLALRCFKIQVPSAPV